MLVQAPGFEPGLPVSETGVLPVERSLNFNLDKMAPTRRIELRQPARQTGILPLNDAGIYDARGESRTRFSNLKDRRPDR